MTAPVRPYLRLVRAPNPGPMTLDGTNTWVLGDPTAAPPVVVDPGPGHDGHREAVLEVCGGRVAAVLLTHGHPDHADGAPRFSDLTGCPVLALGAGLVDQQELTVAGASLTVYRTPGHTADSCSVLVRGADGRTRLVTGDTVLGRGTTVVAHPDGRLADYFGSLAVLELLVDTQGVEELLPGHGPVVADPRGRLSQVRRHRLERLEQIRAARAAGARSPAEVADRVYAGVDPALGPAVQRIVAAQLAFLDS